ncbi:FERM central domain [Trinorchestia longiramus]|nr:FERM central domain [Trinorchestia longiramus]
MVEGGGGGGEGSGVEGRGGAGGRRYGVRAAEVAMHRALNVIRVEVVLLDDSPHVFEIQKHAKGQALLDLVFSHLELLERAYFGLQYRDTRCPASQPDQRWLDPLKTVKKQLRIHSRTIDTCELPVLYFRVKFWVTDPGRLTEEYTRYHVTLQLRCLLADGTLPAPDTTAALLASYALQCETLAVCLVCVLTADFGDYRASEHGTDYLKEAELMPPVPPHMLQKVIELHKLHKGQSPADAEFQFLRHAKRLELYGVDLHAAKDSCERDLSVGVTSSGLVVIMNDVRMNTFSWAKIIKISFKRRQFMIQLRREMCSSALHTTSLQYTPQVCSTHHKSAVHTTSLQYTPQVCSTHHKSAVHTTSLQYTPQVNGGDAELLHRQTAILKPASFLQSIRNKVWGKVDVNYTRASWCSLCLHTERASVSGSRVSSIIPSSGCTLRARRRGDNCWVWAASSGTAGAPNTKLLKRPRGRLLPPPVSAPSSGESQGPHVSQCLYLRQVNRLLGQGLGFSCEVSPSKQASLATLATNGAAAASGGSSSSGSGHTKRALTASAGSQGARGRSDSCGYRVTSLPSTPKLAWTEGDKPSRPPPLNGSSGAGSWDTSRDDTTEDVSSSLVVTCVGDRPCTPARLPSVLSLLPSSAAPSPLPSSPLPSSSIASSKTPSKESSVALPSVLCSSNASSYPAVASSSLAPLAAHEGDLPSSSSSSASSKSSSSSSASDSDTAAAIAELQHRHSSSSSVVASSQQLADQDTSNTILQLPCGRKLQRWVRPGCHSVASTPCLTVSPHLYWEL